MAGRQHTHTDPAYPWVAGCHCCCHSCCVGGHGGTVVVCLRRVHCRWRQRPATLAILLHAPPHRMARQHHHHPCHCSTLSALSRVRNGLHALHGCCVANHTCCSHAVCGPQGTNQTHPRTLRCLPMNAVTHRHTRPPLLFLRCCCSALSAALLLQPVCLLLAANRLAGRYPPAAAAVYNWLVQLHRRISG